MLATATLLPTIDVTLKISLTPSSGSPVSATRVGFLMLAKMHVPVKLDLIHRAPNVPLDITYLTEAVFCVQVVPLRVPVT